MDYNKLYYFYIVAKYEHITKAAEYLRIAQPAITKTIKQLEMEFGVPLFQKKGRNIELTDYGLYLKNKLEHVYAPLSTIPEELERLKKRVNHTIRLNVLAASTVVTDAVIEYKKQNKDVIFQFVQQEEKDRCDISISTNSIHYAHNTNYYARCIIEEQILLAVPQTSDYAALESVNLQDLSHENFVELANSRFFRSICDVFCAYAGFQPNIIFESDSPETVKNIIKANLGIAFWPKFSWGKLSASSEVVLLPISNPICQREIIVELHNSAAISDSAKDFYEYLVHYLKRIQQLHT